MGYLAVGGDYSSIGELGRASEYYTKAFQLRERASEREKLAIAGSYYRSVTGELDKAAQTYQEEIESYPQKFPSVQQLGRSVYASSGAVCRKPRRSRGKACALHRSSVVFYANLANFTLALEHFDEALGQIFVRRRRRKLDHAIFHNALYALAFLGEDSAAMAEQQEWYAGQPAFESRALRWPPTQRRMAVNKQGKRTDQAGCGVCYPVGQQGKGGHLAGECGTAASGLWQRRRTPPFSRRGFEAGSGESGRRGRTILAFAIAGDTARAESLAQDLGKRFPLNTQMQSLWLPAIQAQLALGRKNPASALGIPQAGSPLELGLIDFALPISCLYPVYVRGEAYLAAGQGRAAAAEFQKILDHSGIVWNCWTGALARLGVARANALQAKNSQGADADAARVRALAAYKDFLTLWKDADPDIPILKEAKVGVREAAMKLFADDSSCLSKVKDLLKTERKRTSH